jgi:hypothetical protein
VPTTEHPKSYGGLRVLVAGGGVAGLEALLALRALAGDLVDLELLAPEPAFWYRPLAVAEPFDVGRVHHFELAGIAESAAASFTLDRLATVDADARIVRTGQGAEIGYDLLVITCGAVPRPWLADALTFRGPADSDAFRRLLAEADSGSVRSIAFTLPAGGIWPLPLYELALLTATYLAGRGNASIAFAGVGDAHTSPITRVRACAREEEVGIARRGQGRPGPTTMIIARGGGTLLGLACVRVRARIPAAAALPPARTAAARGGESNSGVTARPVA